MDAVNKYIRTYAFDTKGDLSKLPGQIEKFLQPNNMAIASKVFSKEELSQMRRLSDVAAMISKQPGKQEEKNSLFFTALQRFTPGIVSAVSSIFHGPLGAFAGTVASETALRGGQSIGRSRAIKAEEFGAPVARPERNVLAPVRNPASIYPAETETGYGDARPLTIQGPGNRQQRKSGGRVSDKLVTMVDRARKNINNQTESLLGTHDNHVAQALEIANRNLEG